MIRRIVSLVALCWLLGFALFVVLLPRPAGAETTDAIVVLTGGAGRIERGLTLLEAKRAKRMLVSGVDRTVRPHELAAQYQASPTLFRCCVDLGSEAVDTRSNAEETAAWVEKRGYKTVRLVTTDWHMPRARFELNRALGDEVALRSDAVRSNPAFRTLLTEYNKYLLRRGAVLFGL